MVVGATSGTSLVGHGHGHSRQQEKHKGHSVAHRLHDDAPHVLCGRLDLDETDQIVQREDRRGRGVACGVHLPEVDRYPKKAARVREAQAEEALDVAQR
eukprot:5900056-Prymnesium_polylepis.2